MSSLPEYFEEGSVTGWLRSIRGGNQKVVVDLWKRYFEQLKEFARLEFGKRNRAAEDEEDVALSVIETLCRNVANGKFPNINDRSDLWSLLVVITQSKVCANYRKEFSQKRGGGKVLNMSQLEQQLKNGLLDVFEKKPSAEAFLMITDLVESLCDRMRDPLAKTIALLKLEGRSNREISRELGLVPRTVDRKLNLIREVWSRELSMLIEKENLD